MLTQVWHAFQCLCCRRRHWATQTSLSLSGISFIIYILCLHEITDWIQIAAKSNRKPGFSIFLYYSPTHSAAYANLQARYILGAIIDRDPCLLYTSDAADEHRDV